MVDPVRKVFVLVVLTTSRGWCGIKGSGSITGKAYIALWILREKNLKRR